jgi:cell division protein FtsX
MKKLILFIFTILITLNFQVFASGFLLLNRPLTPEEIFEKDINAYIQNEIDKNEDKEAQQKIIDEYVGSGKKFETKEDFLKVIQPLYQEKIKEKNKKDDNSLFLLFIIVGFTFLLWIIASWILDIITTFLIK